MDAPRQPERLVWAFLIGVILLEGLPIAAGLFSKPIWFLDNLGLEAGPSGSLLSWILATLVAVLFIAATLRRTPRIWNSNKLSALKATVVLMAVVSGIFEEGFFRRFVMDSTADRGWSALAQIAVSALIFGVSHGIWGLFAKHIRPAVTATIATGLLGGMLAVVYIVGGRSLAPCTVAHAVINLFLEPGMMLAAASGQWDQARSSAA